MKHLRILLPGLFGLGLSLFSLQPAQAQDFLNGHEDLPLLSGLVQDPASTLVFDTPRGRVVETYAQSESAAADILKAYDTTLPQMGWQTDGNHRFVRDKETLTFEVISPKHPTVLRILLTSD